MKIAILDNCFLDESQLERLRNIGELICYEETKTEDEAVDRLKGVEIAIVNSFITPLNKIVLHSSSKLRLIAINSTGFDNVDIITAKERNILIANTAGFSTEAVAEHVFALIFAISRKICVANQRMKQEPFELKASNKDHQELIGFDLKDKTLGIIGFGRIGERVAEIGKAFGMRVIFFDRSEIKKQEYEQVELKALLERSDIMSIHLPLTKETVNFVSKDEIEMMKPTSIIINTARGGLVSTADLCSALERKIISGVGIDVVDNLNANDPLLKIDNAIVTPHMAWYTKESLINSPEIIVKNVENFVRGEPSNIVNTYL